MQILSYNILADCTLHHFSNPRAAVLQRDQRTPLVLEELRKSAADIICLQEVDQHAFDDLKNGLDSNYKGHLVLNNDGRFGCAMFVRGPLFDSVRWEQKDFGDGSGRRAQIAITDELMIINVHLDFKKNCEQIKKLVAPISPDKNCLICGDFNASINSGTLRIAQQAGYQTMTTGPTINTDGRSKTIDFVLARGSIKLKSVQTAAVVKDSSVLPSQSQGSDHVAVVAEFEIQ